ncbi:MAG TPA: LysR family transcriptional regulator [Alphaproteobacteria bacterium]|nr:LysR family transcriptional regulator [Alphaproteobacteria bacterium]
MDIERARTFLEIAEAGTFVKAAERLNITQSTASMRIKALEDSLGRPLFARSKAGAQLTPAGQQFRRYATTMVRAWQQARQDVALPPGFQAVLGIGGQYSLWDRLLIKWLPWIRKAMPDVAVRAEVGTADGLIRQLGEGLLDIAVMYAPQSRTGFVIEPLFQERLVMVSTEPDEPPLITKRYIFVDWGPAFLSSHTQAFPDLATPAVSCSIGSLGLAYLLETGGTGYFPIRMVRPHIEAKRLHLVAEAPEFRRPAYAVYPQASAQEPLFTVALKGLRDLAAAEAEE